MNKLRHDASQKPITEILQSFSMDQINQFREVLNKLSLENK